LGNTTIARFTFPRLTILAALGVLFLAAATGVAAQGDPAGAAQPQTKLHNHLTLGGDQNYEPISGLQRFHWVLVNSIGPAALAGRALSSGLSTVINDPSEYGPSWAGFGKRYGIGATGALTGDAMEASLGALWGEDPRYFRAQPQTSFGSRVRHVVVTAFLAPRRDGMMAPAYARFIAIPGSNFLSNTWRVSSEATVSEALSRTLIGMGRRVAGNAFAEFWPDFRNRISRSR